VTPYSDDLKTVYGDQFVGLIGKTVDVSGDVMKWREGAGIKFMDMRQIKVLQSAADFKESRPEWLNGPGPVTVDSPKYLAWKKFQPGAAATYESYLFSEHQPGANQYTRTKISRSTFRLESVDDKKVVTRPD